MTDPDSLRPPCVNESLIHSRIDVNGELHRVFESANGTKEWWFKGKRHRTDGPAIEFADGTKYWYLRGMLHREDGPAYESANGGKEWYINGVVHRTDGPACEYANGTKVWYINGEEMGEFEFQVNTLNN